MNYIDTATSLLAMLPNLPQTSTTDAGYSTTVEAMKLHVTRAENIVNGKVVGRYDINAWTQTTCPPMLKALAEDLASYFIMRSVYVGDNQNDNEWTDKFKEALVELDEVRKGDMQLFDSAGSLIAERDSGTTDKVISNTEDYIMTFGEDKPLNWRIDRGKLDALSNDRN